jgi:hypothetical protein
MKRALGCINCDDSGEFKMINKTLAFVQLTYAIAFVDGQHKSAIGGR